MSEEFIKNYIFLYGDCSEFPKENNIVAIDQNILLDWNNLDRQMLNKSSYWSFEEVKGCPFAETCNYLAENIDQKSLSKEVELTLGVKVIDSFETIIKCHTSGNMVCKSIVPRQIWSHDLYSNPIPFEQTIQQFFKQYFFLFQHVCQEFISPRDSFFFHLQPIDHVHHHHVPNLFITTFFSNTSDSMTTIQDKINEEIPYNVQNYFLVDLVTAQKTIFWFFEIRDGLN